MPRELNTITHTIRIVYTKGHFRSIIVHCTYLGIITVLGKVRGGTYLIESGGNAAISTHHTTKCYENAPKTAQNLTRSKAPNLTMTLFYQLRN